MIGLLGAHALHANCRMIGNPSHPIQLFLALVGKQSTVNSVFVFASCIYFEFIICAVITVADYCDQIFSCVLRIVGDFFLYLDLYMHHRVCWSCVSTNSI